MLPQTLRSLWSESSEFLRQIHNPHLNSKKSQIVCGYDLFGYDKGRCVKVYFSSLPEDKTSYSIDDHISGRSVETKSIDDATGNIDLFSYNLVKDLNILLFQRPILKKPGRDRVIKDDVKYVILAAAMLCESRQGEGVDGGDFVWVIT